MMAGYADERATQGTGDNMTEGTEPRLTFGCTFRLPYIDPADRSGRSSSMIARADVVCTACGYADVS
jgi:hypothetical protein